MFYFQKMTEHNQFLSHSAVQPLEFPPQLLHDEEQNPSAPNLDQYCQTLKKKLNTDIDEFQAYIQSFKETFNQTYQESASLVPYTEQNTWNTESSSLPYIEQSTWNNDGFSQQSIINHRMASFQFHLELHVAANRITQLLQSL